MELREELALYKIRSGKTYKKIAEELNIGYATLNKFTSGARLLTPENERKLVTYLSENK